MTDPGTRGDRNDRFGPNPNEVITRLHRLNVVEHPVHSHHDAFRCGRTNVQLQARCPGITIARLANRSGVHDETASSKVE